MVNSVYARASRGLIWSFVFSSRRRHTRFDCDWSSDVCSSDLAGSEGSLPPYISVPCFLRSGGPGFLGASYAPFVIEADPASPEFAVRDVVLPEGGAGDRGQRRQGALRGSNRFERRAEGLGQGGRALGTVSRRALR